jgi:hypothetical protein
MAWIAQHAFVAVLIRAASPQRDVVVYGLAEVLTVTAQVAVAFPDAVPVSYACAASLALYCLGWLNP